MAKRHKRNRKKRANNEGSIFFNKQLDRWVGSVTVGYRDDGKQKRQYVYGRSQAEVNEKLSKLKYEYQAGLYVAPDKLTVGEWIARYLETYVKPNVRLKTYTAYEDMAKKHIIPELGKVNLQKLQTSQLQEFYNRKREKGRLDGTGGLSSRAIHMMHRVISGALKQALKEGKVQRDISGAVKLPPLKYKEMQPLTAEQAGRFLEAAKEHRLYPAFELELGTGLRRGELLALRWQDVDLQKGTVTVRRSLLRVRVGEKKTELRFSEPKTEKGKRTIPIPKRVVSILAAYRKQVIEDALKLGQKFKEDWLLFSVPFNRPIDPDNFGKQYVRLLKKAGIPHRAFHNLRHTVATILLERGEHPKIVQELLGHARVGITLDVYSHVDGEIMQRAASKLDEALSEAEESAKRAKGEG